MLGRGAQRFRVNFTKGGGVGGRGGGEEGEGGEGEGGEGEGGGDKIERARYYYWILEAGKWLVCAPPSNPPLLPVRSWIQLKVSLEPSILNS